MLSSIYLHRFIMHELPISPQQRHTDFRLCLCQYIEHVLDDYFKCTKSGMEIAYIVKTFQEKFSFRVPVVNSKQDTCVDTENIQGVVNSISVQMDIILKYVIPIMHRLFLSINGYIFQSCVRSSIHLGKVLHTNPFFLITSRQDIQHVFDLKMTPKKFS